MVTSKRQRRQQDTNTANAQNVSNVEDIGTVASNASSSREKDGVEESREITNDHFTMRDERRVQEDQTEHKTRDEQETTKKKTREYEIGREEEMMTTVDGRTQETKR